MSNLTTSLWAPRNAQKAQAQRDFNSLPAQRDEHGFLTSTHPAPSPQSHEQPRSTGGPLNPQRPEAIPPPLLPSQPERQNHNIHLRTRLDQFAKYTKLLRRLRWKAHHLLISQSQVLAHHSETTPSTPLVWSQEVQEAETMFKVDFFEFYVLLERALVCLLGVFGTVVRSSGRMTGGADDGTLLSSRYAPVVERPLQSTRPQQETMRIDGGSGSGPTQTNGISFATGIKTGTSIIGDTHVLPKPSNTSKPSTTNSSLPSHSNQPQHQFHAAVLHTLSQPTHPLHPLLGTGDVRAYLGIAKEFRNRWKDADDPGPDPAGATSNQGDRSDGDKNEEEVPVSLRRYAKQLQHLKLETMLDVILTSLYRAKERAEGEVGILMEQAAKASGERDGNGNMIGDENVDVDIEMEGLAGDVRGMAEEAGSAPWEAMPDAMDWD